MTSWRLVVAPSAERSLAPLPEKVAPAIVEFMLGPLIDNPHRVGKPLIRELAGYMSARRGAYRIVYRIVEESSHVEVVRIDHRSRVYRSSLAARTLGRWQQQVSELPSPGLSHATALEAVKAAKDDLENG